LAFSFFFLLDGGGGFSIRPDLTPLSALDAGDALEMVPLRRLMTSDR